MNLVYLVCAFLSLFFLGFMDMARGPIYPELLGHFGLGTKVGSYFFTVASFSALLANLTYRWWMRWWSTIQSLFIFTILQVIGGAGMSWAAYWPNGFFWVLVFAFIFGLALGGLGVAINVLAVEASNSVWQKRVLSGVHMMYGLAALLAPLVVNWVVEGLGDWRLCYFILSLGPACLALYCLFFVKMKDVPPTISDNSQPLSREAWIFATAMAFYVGAEMVVSTRLVLYLRTDFDFTATRAGVYLSLFFLGLMGGRFANALIKWPFSQWWTLFAANVMTLILFTLGLFVHPIGLVLTGFTMAPIFPDFVSAAASIRRHESDRIVAVGVTGVAVVLVVMHWGVGLLAEIIGLKLAMSVGIGFLAIVIFLLFYLKSDFLALKESEKTASPAL